MLSKYSNQTNGINEEEIQEAANEIIAEGGSPSANRYVDTVYVNVQNGEVTTDMGDAWNLY